MPIAYKLWKSLMESHEAWGGDTVQCQSMHLTGTRPSVQSPALRTKQTRAREIAQSVKHLLNDHENLSLDLWGPHQKSGCGDMGLQS